MPRHPRPIIILAAVCMLAACRDGSESSEGGASASAQTPAPAPSPAGSEVAPNDGKADAGKVEDAPTTAIAPDPVEPPPVEPPPVEPPTDPLADAAADVGEGEAGATEGVEAAAADEIAITPWAATTLTRSWRLAAEPGGTLALLTTLDAGVLAKAEGSWQQLGADGQLVAATMDREPTLPILGRWPDDAWSVESRSHEEDDFEIIELRLMKLRGGNRWVPQEYNGSQWFHPGTDDEVAPHISAITGMLVYNASLTDMTRVAGKTGEPEFGVARGAVIDFLETGSGKVYLISRDESGTYAQTYCEDDECVAAQAQRFPAGSWRFGRRVARGRYAASVLATTADNRSFVLNQKGKAGGWVLDELSGGEAPSGMWASDEGGLWTLTGDHLRWRDTDSAWHEVTLPPGLSGASATISADRRELWLAGSVGGATKVYVTHANAEAPAPAP